MNERLNKLKKIQKFDEINIDIDSDDDYSEYVFKKGDELDIE